jgi:ABC-2 type transport system permease protein
LVFGAFTAFLVGLFPKFISLIWIPFGYSFVIFYFGRLTKMPDWAIQISAFGATPQLPIESFTPLPLIILTTIAVALTFIGFNFGYKRRDL